MSTDDPESKLSKRCSYTLLWVKWEMLGRTIGNTQGGFGVSAVLPTSSTQTYITNYTSSNHRLESAGLNALEELLFRCWQ